MTHMLQLDGLRCLMFLSVFFHHAWPDRNRSGRAGVPFFFGLSGFQALALDHLAIPWARHLLPYCGEDLLWGYLAGRVGLRARVGRFDPVTGGAA